MPVTTAQINTKRVGFLATGSEITSGEILNTNGQKMAQALQLEGVNIGEHVVVDDQENNLLAALTFLFNRHEAVILTGGLGPTSDDRTRHLVAELANQPLVFNDDSWQRIVERLSSRYLNIPDCNRQQALFPETAAIYPNANGTADGFHIQCQDRLLYILPGPPSECLPMFHNEVVPSLDQHGFTTNKRLFRWRLMGVAESAIAESLEPIAEQYQLEIAYRAAYPYIDIKLQLDTTKAIKPITNAVLDIVNPYLVTTEHSNISTQLKHALAKFNQVISITDHATRGHFIADIVNPQNQHALIQSDQMGEAYSVEIKGLDEFWQPQPNVHLTKIYVTLHYNGARETFEQTIFLRGQETIRFAIEFISHQIWKHFIQK